MGDRSFAVVVTRPTDRGIAQTRSARWNHTWGRLGVYWTPGERSRARDQIRSLSAVFVRFGGFWGKLSPWSSQPTGVPDVVSRTGLGRVARRHRHAGGRVLRRPDGRRGAPLPRPRHRRTRAPDRAAYAAARAARLSLQASCSLRPP